MRHLSVKIPDHLYKDLESKAQAMGNLTLSEALRILLCAAIDNPLLEAPSNYGLKTYTLLHEAILSLVEDPNPLMDRAAHKAKQLAQHMDSPPVEPNMVQGDPKTLNTL